ANQLVLRDVGRPAKYASASKPAGSVHGDSIGVHACDSINALRHMSTIANRRNSVTCLLMAAYQVAHDRSVRSPEDFTDWQPHPWAEAAAKIKATEPGGILQELDGAIRENNQAQACAAAAKYAATGQSARPLFDLLLRYAISEDGALHAEKYFNTASE